MGGHYFSRVSSRRFILVSLDPRPPSRMGCSETGMERHLLSHLMGRKQNSSFICNRNWTERLTEASLCHPDEHHGWFSDELGLAGKLHVNSEYSECHNESIGACHYISSMVSENQKGGSTLPISAPCQTSSMALWIKQPQHQAFSGTVIHKELPEERLVIRNSSIRFWQSYSSYL